jgi:hypothetical protein
MSPQLATRSQSRRRLVAVVAPLLLWLAAAPSAGAQGATFSLTTTDRHPYFIFHANPGAVLQGRIRVLDVSSTAGQVELYGADATTGQTTGAVYLSRQATSGVGRWLSVSTPSLPLAAHQNRTVAFTVRVPSNVRGGQYLAGLVAQPDQVRSTEVTHKGKRTFRVNIQEIAIVAVQVDVPGAAQPGMSITGVNASGRPGYQTVAIGLANTGNTLLKGHGHLTVVAANGRQALSRSFNLDTFVPHTHVAFPVYVSGKRLAPGRYAASVAITYGDHQTQARTFRFAITGKQVRQTYGTTAPATMTSPIAPAGPGIPVWVLILGGLALVGASIGGSAWYFRNPRDAVASGGTKR